MLLTDFLSLEIVDEAKLSVRKMQNLTLQTKNTIYTSSLRKYILIKLLNTQLHMLDLQLNRAKSNFEMPNYCHSKRRIGIKGK